MKVQHGRMWRIARDFAAMEGKEGAARDVCDTRERASVDVGAQEFRWRETAMAERTCDFQGDHRRLRGA